MAFDGFTGLVQKRLALPSTGETPRVIRTTRTTLDEHLQTGEASDLAGSLPMEIDRYLLEADSSQRFDWDEFVDRVREREKKRDPDDRADDAYHARVIVDIVNDGVPPGEVQQVRDGFPAAEDGTTLRLP